MPDINQLFDHLHIAHLRALHAPCSDERDTQRANARVCAEALQGVAYPQPGSFLPG
jgi:hypothetical protein